LLKNRKIITPKGWNTRPSSGQLREALFNICQTYIKGSRFLDLFAGSGAIGMEALSRGASMATFIDIERQNIRCIQQNIELLQLESQVTVISGDVMKELESLVKKGVHYDIIFADPPYAQGKTVKGEFMYYGKLILNFLDKNSLLSQDGMLFIEEADEVEIENLKVNALTFKSSRRFGRSRLCQYQAISEFL
jgi:16S rRNA (guanine966-N2)-methyltransferase